MNNQVKISIVIPIFNEADSIPQLVKEVLRSMRSMNQSFELILVNDSSLDDSWLEIQKLSRNFSYVTGLNLSENFGQHSAIMAGLG